MRRRAAHASSSEEAGFSLIEMIVVVAILSLSMTVAFFSFQSAQRPKTPEVLAREASYLVQFVRLDAINSRRQRSLVIDMATRTISNERGDRTVFVPTGIAFSAVTGRELIRADTRAFILFLPDGSSSGGEVSFDSGGPSAVLRIPWLTGVPLLEVARKPHG